VSFFALAFTDGCVNDDSLWSSVGRAVGGYDLLWPTRRRPPQRKDLGGGSTGVSVPTVVEDALSAMAKGNATPASTALRLAPTGSLMEVQTYARRLLESFAAIGTSGDEGESDVLSPIETLKDEEDGFGMGGGCREAVEILTRNPKKGLLYPHRPSSMLTDG
jgi:hypothetical protein